MDKEQIELIPPLDDVFLTITPSHVCNLRCNFCFQESYDNKIHLSEEVLFENLAPVLEKTRDLLILGGEITVTPGLKKFVQTINQKYPSINLEFVTNGTNLDDEWIDLCIRTKAKVIVSLNASDPILFRDVLPTYPNAETIWAKVYANTVKLITQKQQSGIVQPRVILSLMVNERSVVDIEPFAKLAYTLGAECKFIYDCRGVAYQNHPEIKSTYRLVKRLKEDYRGLMPIYIVNLPRESDDLASGGLDRGKPNSELNKSFGTRLIEINGQTVCGAPWHDLVLLPNGDTFCCSRLPNYVVGNINRQDISEIWSGDEIEYLRAQMLDGQYPFCDPNCPFNQNPDSYSPGKTYLSKRQALFDKGMYAEAFPLFGAYLKRAKAADPQALYSYAYCAHQLGESAIALDYYQKALHFGFSEFWVKYNRGLLWSNLGENEKALIDLSRAAELNPDHEVSSIVNRMKGKSS